MLKNTEFELLPNSPQVKGLTRLFSVAALPGLTVVVVAFATGWLSGEGTVGVALTVILLTAAYLWGFQAMGRGVVEISPDRLIVRSRSGRRRQIHTWTDIAEIRLNTMRQIGAPDRIFAAIARVDADLPFVEVRLKRRLRVNPLFGQIGSFKFGTPGLLKSVRIYVRDPDGLVRAAQSYLNPRPSP